MGKEELIKEFRVKEILEATRRTIGRFGYEGTTIDRVAEEASIAKGTIYLYFPNKEELLHSAVVEGIRDLNKELVAGDDPAAPGIQRVARLIREMFRIQRSHEDFFKALILDSRFVIFEPGDRREEELRRVYLDMIDYVAKVLGCAMKQGAIRELDPQLAALTMSEMMTAPLRRRLLGLTTALAETDAEAVLELFLYGVRGVRPEVSGK